MNVPVCPAYMVDDVMMRLMDLGVHVLTVMRAPSVNLVKYNIIIVEKCYMAAKNALYFYKEV